MLYLIGGVPRAGKTTVAKKFMAQTGVPYFSLDYLMMGIARGVPSLQISPAEDELIVAERLCNIVEPMITAMVENKVDYLLEGAQLLPRHVFRMSQRFHNKIRACFLGFSEVDSQAKCNELSKYSKLSENDWLGHYTQGQLVEEVQRLISQSCEIRSECSTHDIAYFDILDDFEGSIETVVKFLVDGREN